MNSLSDLLTDKAEELDVSLPEVDEPDQSSAPIVPVTPPPPTPEIDIEGLKTMAYALKDQAENLIAALNGQRSAAKPVVRASTTVRESDDESVIEGVFNGKDMVGPDGKEYSVPPNYASKSKLVEGDMMKLKIRPDGSFIFKSIGPIERKRIVGLLEQDMDSSQWSVRVNGRAYKILTASVTFYRGNPGDEVVILVPTDGESTWGAVENIIQK